MTALTTMDRSVPSKTKKKTNVHPLLFNDNKQLYRAYMPYIRHGGLFVKTTQNYQLGDEVFLLIQLPGETQKNSIAGKVVWLTPVCAQGGKASGIGVGLLGKEGDDLSQKISKLLANLLTGNESTDTM